jgi:hypothetical protein
MDVNELFRYREDQIDYCTVVLALLPATVDRPSPPLLPSRLLIGCRGKGVSTQVYSPVHEGPVIFTFFSISMAFLPLVARLGPHEQKKCF